MRTILPAPPVMKEAPQKPKVERRSNRRDLLTAAATVLDVNSGAKLVARTTDVSPAGCYVDTLNPFPPGTRMQLRLTKNGESFLADAEVAYSQLGVGMGVIFTTAAPDQLAALDKWIREAHSGPVPKKYSLEPIELLCAGIEVKDAERFAVEELLVLLMRKGLLTTEEGEPILRRLLHPALAEDSAPE